MVITPVRPGYVRLTVPGGYVHDRRTGREYSQVVCREGYVHYYEAVVYESEE